tara:strand:- start:5028 stop:5702 length:675 start_codon:yes stop_codon:yes gene_type:complete
MLKIVWKLTPFFIKKNMLNIFAIFKWHVKIGRGSFVSLGCVFQKHNVVMEGSFVAYSQLGQYSYIANHSRIVKTKVGAFCSIGDNVRTCVGKHPLDKFSTHPQIYSTEPPSNKKWVESNEFLEHSYLSGSSFVVEIGNDVWIGNNVIIMDGVTIGNGAVIASGAVVVKNVEAYSVVGGVPAKHIKFRFELPIRKTLIQSQWWDQSDDWISQNMDDLNKVCKEVV